MNNKTIYIYCGFSKTGGTVFDSFLESNQSLLNKLGYAATVIFPTTPIDTKITMAETFILNNMEKFHTIIINDDAATYRPDILYKGFLKYRSEGFNIKFIVNLRKAAEYYFSTFAFGIGNIKIIHLNKNTYSTPEKSSFHYEPIFAHDALLVDFLLAKNDDYHNYRDYTPLKNIINFANFFDDKNIDPAFKESIIFRPFEKKGPVKENLLSDWLRTVNITKPVDEFNYVDEIQGKTFYRGTVDALQIFEHACFNFNLGILNTFVHTGNFGDQRPFVETVPDKEIKEITDYLAPSYTKMAKLFLNQDAVFKNPYPNCYKQDRPSYKPLSLEEIAKIQEFIAGQRAYRMHEDIMTRFDQIDAKIDQSQNKGFFKNLFGKK